MIWNCTNCACGECEDGKAVLKYKDSTQLKEKLTYGNTYNMRVVVVTSLGSGQPSPLVVSLPAVKGVEVRDLQVVPTSDNATSGYRITWLPPDNVKDVLVRLLS